MNSVAVILCLFFFMGSLAGVGGGGSSLNMWKTESENGQIFYQECLTCQQE